MAEMLNRVCRLAAVVCAGVSVASAVIVTLFSILILVGAFFQSCVESYRQEHAHLDLILDSLGLPLMSSFIALMTKRISRIWSATTEDSSFGSVSLHEGARVAFWQLLLAGVSLAVAVFVCNRYAIIWSYCRVTADSG